MRFEALIIVFAPVANASPTQAPSTAKSSIVAFHNVDVFEGTRMVRRVNVVIENGRVRAVGRGVEIPALAKVVEGEGKTLLPGLIDSHTHLGERLVTKFLEDALDFGVTTELEMGGSAESLRIRKEGCPKCADFLTAGTVVTAPGGHPTQMGGAPIPPLSQTDDANVQAFVDARLAEGSDYIKIMDEHHFPALSTSQIKAIVVAAHRRNKLAVAHVGSQKEAFECIEAGVDGLAHVFADSAPNADFAGLVKDHHAFVIPTLAVFESLSAGADKRWWEKNLA
jgi:imidazolonepropionase-like amidohydrolase